MLQRTFRHRTERTSTRALVTLCTIAALSASVSLAPSTGRAQSAHTDGVYGRLRRDTVFVLEAGGGVGFAGGEVRPAFSTAFRVRALDTIGPMIAYQNAPSLTAGGARQDALGLGLDLRVLTLGRIFTDSERGPQTFDLWLDSIGLELGAAWLRPGAPWGQGSGIGFWLGGGMEVPLFWSEGNAFCLRLQARWTHSIASDALASGPAQDDAVLLTANLVVRLMANLGHIRSPR
ncbi:MAG: hypothetical protein JNK05_10625 [Myxococcales bacterium]|nr:hypothetical protein [Myxococcales bacterium]